MTKTIRASKRSMKTGTARLTSHLTTFITSMLLATFLLGTPLMARVNTGLTPQKLFRLSTTANSDLGKIKIRMPDIAENGAEVGITVQVEEYKRGIRVEEVIIYSSLNRTHPVARFRFPEGTRPFVRFRIKMAKTGFVHVFARFSDGRILHDKKQVKVTIGGCGGGGGSYTPPPRAYNGYRQQQTATFRAAMRRKQKKTKTNKTWKRSNLVPNTSRIRVGDKEELKLQSMQVNVRIDGFRARVLLDMEFFNPFNRNYEGTFQVRLPQGASPYYLAFGQSVYRTDHRQVGKPRLFSQQISNRISFAPKGIMSQRRHTWENVKVARMVPKAKAAHAYHETVNRRIDPALLEWAGAGVFNARVFPIAPNRLHKVVLGYDMDLVQLNDFLHYEIDLPDTLGASRVNISVATGSGMEFSSTPAIRPTRIGDRLHYNYPVNHTDRIKLRFRSSSRAVLVGHDLYNNAFFATRWQPRLPKMKAADRNSRAVFMLDTSLSANPDQFNVYLKLLDAILRNNRGQVREFAVLFFNIDTHWWQKRFVANTPANRQRLLAFARRLALEGATDIDRALRTAYQPGWAGRDKRGWNLFLLSDGHSTWGENNAHLIKRFVQSQQGKPLYAYLTGIGTTDKPLLQKVAAASGGAVFSVTGEDQVQSASIAHRVRPWQIEKVVAGKGHDLVLAGNPQTIFPGQSLTVVGRGLLHTNQPIRLYVRQGMTRRVLTRSGHRLLHSMMTARVYGQVAVNRLEQFEHVTEKVSQAYAMHFRVTGKTTSLLMLENEAQYRRFNIRPKNNLFVVRHQPVNGVVGKLLKNQLRSLADPKTRFLAYLRKLERHPGIRFRLSAELETMIRQLPGRAFNIQRKNLTSTLGVQRDQGYRYLKSLQQRRIDYDLVIDEAASRANRNRGVVSRSTRLKVLSTLVENRPGDSVLVRDVGYSAIAMGYPGEAYHLFRRAMKQRPGEPQNYRALANMLVSMKKYDLAMLYYEIGLNGQWNSRFGDYKHILALDYLHLLNKVKSGKARVHFRGFAKDRREFLSQKYNMNRADLVVNISWNTDATDIDLHVTEPSGETAYYKNRRTYSGGELTRDVTRGYGPELYLARAATPGTYVVRAHYYNRNRNRASTRTKVYATVYKHWGTPWEKVIRKTIVLKDRKAMHRIARIRF